MTTFWTRSLILGDVREFVCGPESHEIVLDFRDVNTEHMNAKWENIVFWNDWKDIMNGTQREVQCLFERGA